MSFRSTDLCLPPGCVVIPPWLHQGICKVEVIKTPSYRIGLGWNGIKQKMTPLCLINVSRLSFPANSWASRGGDAIPSSCVLFHMPPPQGFAWSWRPMMCEKWVTFDLCLYLVRMQCWISKRRLHRLTAFKEPLGKTGAGYRCRAILCLGEL